MGVDIRITLTAFTVLAPAGAISFLLLALPIICQQQRAAWVERLEHWLVLPLAVCMLGLVASATHLGTPGNALYTFNGWGRSPLSNEVASALGFLIVAGVYWLASFWERLPFVFRRIWLVISCVTALWLVSMISVVYAIPTIPTWNNALVPWSLWLTTLTSAPLLTLATLAFANKMGVKAALSIGYIRALFGTSALSLVATLTVLALQNAELPQIQNALGSAAELVPWYGWMIVGYALLGALGLATVALPILRQKLPKLAPALAGTALLLAGAALSRVAFYSLHMTL